MNILNRVFNYIWSGSSESIAYSGAKNFRLGTENVTPDTINKVSAYNRAVNIIKSHVAKLNFEIYDSQKNKINNSIRYLLNVSPDGELNAFDFKSMMIERSINRGNFYARIIKTYSGEIKALKFIDDSRVTPKRDLSGKLYYEITNSKTSSVRLENSDVIHIKSPWLSSDGLTGMSVSTYGRDVLGISLNYSSTILNFFKNVVLPLGIYKTKGNLDPESHSRIKSNFNKDEETGSDSRGSIAIVEGQHEYENLEYDEDPLQFVKSRKFTVAEIARFLNINTLWLSDTDLTASVKFNDLELNLYKDTLSPWITKIECEINMKLLNFSYADKYCRADVDILTLEDKKSMAEYYNKLHQNTVYSGNEIRSKLNESDYEGGNRRFVALNNLKPLDRIDEMIDSEIESSKPQLQPRDVTEDVNTMVIEMFKGSQDE